VPCWPGPRAWPGDAGVPLRSRPRAARAGSGPPPPPILVHGLGDRRQRRDGVGRLGHIVIAHHRQVLGHPKAQFRGDLEDPDGGKVVGGKDGGRSIRTAEQLPGRVRGLGGPVAADPDQAGIESEARRLERLPVALLALPRRDEVGAATHVSDPRMPQTDQVLSGGAGSGDVVGFDGAGPGASGVRIDRHHRNRGVGHGRRRCHDHRAVDQRSGQPGQRAPLPADVVVALVAGVGQQFVAGPLGRAGDALEQLSGEGLELRHQHSDHVGAVPAQAARNQRGLVAELGNHVHHFVVGLRSHSVAVVDHLRHGRHRHARNSRHVDDGHPRRVSRRNGTARSSGTNGHGRNGSPCVQHTQKIATKTLSKTFDTTPTAMSGSRWQEPLSQSRRTERSR